MRRGGRGVCRFRGLRLCEDTYRKVDKTWVVQIIVLQGCERGSGFYDRVTAWVSSMWAGKERHQNTKKNKDKRGITFLAKDSGGGGDDNEKENMVLETRVMKQQEKGKQEKGWGLDSPSPPIPSQ